MAVIKVAVIPGDGIGPEVVREGVESLKTVEALIPGLSFTFDFFPWGSEFYLQHGKMMDDDGIEQLRHYDAIILGAVGAPEVSDSISLRGLLLKIRQEFDQYVNLRPVKLLEGVSSPLKDKTKVDIDFIVVRENSEGEYAGLGGIINRGKADETVLQTGVFSRRGTERIIRYAFELAQQTHQKLTNVSKANALNYSMVFWDSVFSEVAEDYPDVQTETLLVDAASMFFVKDPGRFEVVVTSNLFGDILTDLGAAIAGGMGIAAGANLNPSREFPSMFEPIHGSAPDIAGKAIANPFATLWTVSQLLDFFGYTEIATIMIDTIEQQIVEAEVLTADMGGSSSTHQVGDHFRLLLEQRLKGI